MNAFKAITTVYSYYLPEVRELITALTREYTRRVPAVHLARAG